MLKICFNDGWQFETGRLPFNSEERCYGDKREVTLPHDFMIEGERDKNALSRRDGAYYLGGVGRYSKKFDAPEDWADKNVYAEFDGVFCNARVRLNGDEIMRQNYGYTSFRACLDKYLRYGESNELSVIADASAQPNSRWYAGAGIYRPVRLWVAEKNHIEFGGVYVKTVELRENSAKIAISAEVAGTLDALEFVINESGGAEVARFGGCAGVTAVYELNAPKLWTPETPNLYRLTVNLSDCGKIVDKREINFGVRTVEISAERGLLLNGESIKLKGGCIHHDNGPLGAASYLRSEERKVELLKSAGYNAVRTAHNPHAPAFLDACDRLGLIVMAEAFDHWRKSKRQYDYHMFFDTDWEHDLTSMILRDRNRPSVFFWSVGNEIVEQCGGSGGAETSRKLAECIRKYDDRPVGMAFNSNIDRDDPEKLGGADKVAEPHDWVGYNYMDEHYKADGERVPGRVIIGTESFPTNAYGAWQGVLDNKHVLGDFVWTAIDYLGEAACGRSFYGDDKVGNIWEDIDESKNYPWTTANCGDFDVCGNKRPQSYYRDIVWGVSDEPAVFARKPAPQGFKPEDERFTGWGWNDCLAGWDFDVEDGTQICVDVYSKSDSVELFLNGASLGVNKTEKYRTSFTVPYKRGEIRAVDAEGRSIAIKSAGKPCKIKLTADRDKLDGGGDLSYITAEITDADGIRASGAANKIYFAADGAGSVIAVGNGDPKSAEPYVGSVRSAFEGRASCVVRANGSGKITINAIAEGLSASSLTITA